MELVQGLCAKRLAKWFRVASPFVEVRGETGGQLARGVDQFSGGGTGSVVGVIETLSVATLKGTRECVENALGGSLSVRNFVVAVVFSDRADVPAVMASVAQVPRVVIFFVDEDGYRTDIGVQYKSAPLSWVWAEHRP
jgi:hypothetical protein